jgi:uncharacterized membrane protein YbaN (DUF454 family)
MIAFLGLGLMAGIVLPIMPTVPFLHAWRRSASRAVTPHGQRSALRASPSMDPRLRDWRDRRAISRKAKVSALLAMAAGVGFTWYVIGWAWVAVSIAVLVIAGESPRRTSCASAWPGRWAR